MKPGPLIPRCSPGRPERSTVRSGPRPPKTSLVTVRPDFPLPPSWRGKLIEQPEWGYDVPKDEEL